MAKKYEEYLAELGVGNGMPTAAEVGQQIMGREPFKYDVNTDELYKQYMDKYSALGKKAMEDTIGKSTALTGGYANSYAQVAGQQAYNDYMSKASDMIPELYQMAYNRYNTEGDNLRNNYAMLLNAENTAYDRAKADEQWDYQVEQNALDRAFADKQFNESVRQFNASNALDWAKYKEGARLKLKDDDNDNYTPVYKKVADVYADLQKNRGDRTTIIQILAQAEKDGLITDRNVSYDIQEKYMQSEDKFPSNPKDGQTYVANDGYIYKFSTLTNRWKSVGRTTAQGHAVYNSTK